MRASARLYGVCVVAALGVVPGLLARGPGLALAAGEVAVEAPEVILRSVPFRVTVKAPEAPPGARALLRAADGATLAERALGADRTVAFDDVVVTQGPQLPLTVSVGDATVGVARALLPGWVSVLPPLAAILLALLVREVLLSLFAGVWVGCLFLAGYNPFAAFLMTIDRFAKAALTEGDHVAIVIFSLLLGGMVGVISRTGGTRAMVEAVAALAISRRRVQLAAWLAGLAVFFDDYANTLIVGNTVRPLSDRLRVSRAKLAYIVDSTAAPVAAVSFVSTWVGFEISLIADGLKLARDYPGVSPVLRAQLEARSAFGIFLDSIPYLFYPLLTILAVAAVAATGRDFGPMLASERRALAHGSAAAPGPVGGRAGELPEPPPGARTHWASAAVPILTVVIAVLAGLVYTGLSKLPADKAPTLLGVFSHADPFSTLLWASLLGCAVAVAIGVGQRAVTLAEAMEASVAGMRAMMGAMVILVLAWALSAVTKSLGTGPYLAGALSAGMGEWLLPAATFLVAAAISFATGTSWGTMSILMPLVFPVAFTIGGGSEQAYSILLGTVGAVLAGSVFGDHCSPISDTTVMSSMASGCNHVEHVRTQLPYACLVGVVAVALGGLPIGWGVSPWLSLAVSAVVVVVAIRVLGTPVAEGEIEPAATGAGAGAHGGTSGDEPR